MQYPLDILPKIEFKKIDQSEDLTGFFLMRGTPDEDIFDESTEQIKNEYLEEDGEEKRFLTWSCNLFNLFQIENLKFSVYNKEMTHYEWDYETEVKEPIYNEDFEVLTEFGCYFLSISEIISNLRVPYTRDKEVDAKAQPYVEHVPTPCNFWHFEMKWKDANQKAISKNMGSKWKNTLVGTMRSYIRNYCLALDEIDQSIIPELKTEAYISVSQEG